jgi:hypothetical protein
LIPQIIFSVVVLSAHAAANCGGRISSKVENFIEDGEDVPMDVTSILRRSKKKTPGRRIQGFKILKRDNMKDLPQEYESFRNKSKEEPSKEQLSRWKNQTKIVFASFFQSPKTMHMVEIETKIMRSNICFMCVTGKKVTQSAKSRQTAIQLQNALPGITLQILNSGQNLSLRRNNQNLNRKAS